MLTDQDIERFSPCMCWIARPLTPRPIPRTDWWNRWVQWEHQMERQPLVHSDPEVRRRAHEEWGAVADYLQRHQVPWNTKHPELAEALMGGCFRAAEQLLVRGAPRGTAQAPWSILEEWMECLTWEAGAIETGMEARHMLKALLTYALPLHPNLLREAVPGQTRRAWVERLYGAPVAVWKILEQYGVDWDAPSSLGGTHAEQTHRAWEQYRDACAQWEQPHPVPQEMLDCALFATGLMNRQCVAQAMARGTATPQRLRL